MESSSKQISVGVVQNDHNKYFLCCFYHPFKKADYSLRKTKNNPQNINLCMKCSIQRASLGEYVFRIAEQISVQKQRISRCTHFKQNGKDKITGQIQSQNNLNKYLQLKFLSKKLTDLIFKYKKKSFHSNKVIKQYEEKLYNINNFHNTLIARLNESFIIISSATQQAIRENRQWYQRTCQSLLLVTRAIRDLQQNISQYEDFLHFNLNYSQQGFISNSSNKHQESKQQATNNGCKQTIAKQCFSNRILQFYGMLYQELQSQMRSTQGLSYSGDCSKVILVNALQLCYQINKEMKTLIRYDSHEKGDIKCEKQSESDSSNQTLF